MRSRALALTATIALAGPTALAFRRGGDFSAAFHPIAPLVAAIAAWVLVVIVALAAPVPLPHGRYGRTALAGMVLLTAWTGASIAWAPVAGSAARDFELDLFYLAAFLVGAAALRGADTRRRLEPALATGVCIVMSYALAVRLLPGIIPSLRTPAADNRLDQPLTYWNAEGALAAMGLALCVRILGDGTRSRLARLLAGAACPGLAAALYLTYSRGALAAGGAALLVLLLAAPTWPQLRAVTLVLGASALTVIAVTLFPTVASLSGSEAAIERQGVLFLGVLLALALATAAVAGALIRIERWPGARVGALALPRWTPIATTAMLLLVVGALVYAGLQERKAPARPKTVASAARLARVDSTRYAYWRVAVRAFAEQPVRGLGASGFAVAWLRERPTVETPRRAHSLELETAANLGLVGLAALAMLLAGTVLAAVRGHRRRPELVAGWCAAATVWLVHSAIDWDWEMPALTLLALLLAAALVGVAEEPPTEPEQAGEARPAARGLGLRGRDRRLARR